VVNLTGAAGAPGQISPSWPSTLRQGGLSRDRSVPKIAESGDCSVGRTRTGHLRKGAVEATATSAEGERRSDASMTKVGGTELLAGVLADAACCLAQA